MGEPGPVGGTDFAAAPYLREIGRGKGSARALTRERAHALMTAIVNDEVGDLALGAILLALRMKGEEAAEIAGFLDALEPHLERAAPVAPAWVVIPSYNGARSTPNLVPLLALMLARAGIPVLLHGQHSEQAGASRPGAKARVTSATILAALGMPPCTTVRDAPGRAAARLPAYLPLAVCAPVLARLVQLRLTLGVRNVAHTLAKLVRPVEGPSLLVSSFTHPEFGRMQAELFRVTGMHAMSLRATDGEAVISARRAQSIDYWKDGSCRTVVSAQGVARLSAALPEIDVDATARWTRAVLDGQAPVPPAIDAQFAAIRAAVSGAAMEPARPDIHEDVTGIGLR